MGTDERPPAGTLIDRLVSRPQGFNLFQAISLLERAAPDALPVGQGHGQMEAVRLGAVVSLGFQPSDVASVGVGSSSGEPFTLTSPVLSLAGAQGPLPMPFTELLLERKASRDKATADFLDIFNHRLLAFLYRSRKKHHMGLNWGTQETSSLASCLDAVSALGLAAGAKGPHGESAWLRHAGLMGAGPRSLTGLIAMLTDRLGHKVRGFQFRGDWQPLAGPDETHLGISASRLGRSAVLGRRAWYQCAGIEIEFGDLSVPRLKRLLPGAREYALTKWLIGRYVQQDLQVELVLQPATRDVKRSVLGHAGGLRLGWTSWLVGSFLADASYAPVRLRMNTVAAEG